MPGGGTKQARRWCFTLNNYTSEDENKLELFAKTKDVGFCVIGRETGESGTKHLQGYVRLQRRIRFGRIKELISPRAHIEVARGTDAQNEEYCTKDSDILVRSGSPQSGTTERGGSNKLADALPGLIVYEKDRTDFELFTDEQPNLAAMYVQHGKRVKECLEDSKRRRTIREIGAEFESVEWKEWQKRVVDYCTEPISPRQILWCVGKQGNEGKTFLSRYLVTKGAIRFENGKSADIKYAYEGEETVVFDFSRSQEERINYEILETIKNGIMFNTKYTSGMKVFKPPRVVVFANFEPDKSQLSADRWNIMFINENI